MKKHILPILTLLAAFAVSASAAFYSVYGLSKLFSGASNAVIVMAGSLEVSKLIITSALHVYWTTLNTYLRTYLLVGTFVLVAITSSGIYGFLSDAYQQTADKDHTFQKRIELLESKKERFNIQMADCKKEREALSAAISNLRTSLSTDNQSQTIDPRTGKVLTQIRASSKSNVKGELDLSNGMNNALFSKIETLNDSVAKYELEIINFRSRETVSELGPLKYLSKLTGSSMDSVVNWFLILLIIVFDPLAIALILTALFAFKQIDAIATPQPIPAPVEIETEPIVIPEPVKVKRKYERKPKVLPAIEVPEIVELEPTPPIDVLPEATEVENVPVIAEDEPTSEVVVPVSLPEPKKGRKSRKLVETALTADTAKSLSDSIAEPPNKKKQ